MFWIVFLLLVQCLGATKRQYVKDYQLSSPRTNVIGVGSASVRVGNTVFVIGGSGDEDVGPAGSFSFLLRDNRVFTIASQSWRSLSPLPLSQQRAWHSADFVGGDTLLVFGGSDGTRYLNDLQAYSIPMNLWTTVGVTGNVPSARAGHASITHNGDLWIFGGITTGRVLLNDVWRFSFGSSSWTRVSALGTAPSPRYLHHAFQGPTDNQVCLFGGSDTPNDSLVFSNSASNSVFCFDTSSSQWNTPIASPGSIPSAFAYLPYQDSATGFSVVGGIAGSAVSSTAYSFTYNGATWTTQALSSPVAYASGEEVQGYAWHFGGLRAPGVLQTKIAALGPAGIWNQVNVGCEPGYTGLNCTEPVCRNNCWNLGRCVAPDLCECIEGFTGPLCEQQICTQCGINLLSLNQEIYWPRAKQKAQKCISQLESLIVQILKLLPPFPSTCASTYNYNYPLNLTEISKISWGFLQQTVIPLEHTTEQTEGFLTP